VAVSGLAQTSAGDLARAGEALPIDDWLR
jgi:hypothetical protein